MPPSAEGKKVLTGGACLALGEVEQPAVGREQFVHHVSELLAAGRSESAARFVRRYPDVALDALRQATSEEARTPALALVARLQDEQCGASGWAPLFQDRAEHPERYSAYETNRQHFVEQLKNGKPRDGLALSITKNVPATFLEVDAFQLQGEALLLSDKPADAATAFTTALNRAQAVNPYWAGQVGLLLGEAQRRAGKTADGTGSWQQAVVLASQLLTAPVPTCDPVFWERASYLRPASASWPGPVIQQFAVALGSAPAQTNPGANSLDESWLWAGIGRWRLARHEPQAALAACKRAESLTLDQHFQAQMQLSQAQALAQLEQPVPAMALLVPLAGRAGDPAAAPALALLGGLKLKAGNTEQALALLKKAVEGTSASWPGRGEAEADLGLAYLMTGSAAEGLRWLHAGQVWFEAAHESDLLRQSLENELRYWEHVNKPDETARLRERLKAL
jgi:tetratricopeptide (TPR) repeat protein